jgi:hypothetical protein
MRPVVLALSLCGAAALLASPASAITCYRILDASDNVVYQDIFPPIDLSESGDAERKALRARNEHMIAMESDRCPRLEFVAGNRINLEEMGQQPPGISISPAGSAPGRSGTTATGPSKSRAAKPPAKPATAN